MRRLALLLRALSAAAQFGGEVTIGAGHGGRVEYVYRPQHGRPSPFGGVVPGVLLGSCSAALLWWNEGRTQREEELLRDARRSVVSVDDEEEEAVVRPSSRVLLHLTGKPSSRGVADPLFPAVRRPALRLRRVAEAYQWKEQEHTHEERVSPTHVRRETSYSYSTTWSAQRIDSHRFSSPGYHTPSPRVEPHTHVSDASDATFACGLHLPPPLLAQLDGWSPVPLGELRLAAGGGEGAYVAPTPRGEALHLPLAAAAVADGMLRGGGGLREERRLDPPAAVEAHLREERGALAVPRLDVAPPPAVGDSRVRFEEVLIPADGVSVLAACAPDGTLLPWQSERRRWGASSAGPQLYMIRPGRRSAHDLLHEASRTASLKKWAYRGGGAALMWLGSYLTLSWLPSLASYLPFVGGAASGLVGSALGLLTLGSSLSLSLAIIALSWLRFRPLHGMLICAAATLLMYGQGLLVQQMSLPPPVVPPPRRRRRFFRMAA